MSKRRREGGVIYIFDERDGLKTKVNDSYVKVVGLENEQEIQKLKSLIEEHCRYTESPMALEILTHFDKSLIHFRKVIPI